MTKTQQWRIEVIIVATRLCGHETEHKTSITANDLMNLVGSVCPECEPHPQPDEAR